MQLQSKVVIKIIFQKKAINLFWILLVQGSQHFSLKPVRIFFVQTAHVRELMRQ